MSNPLAVLQPDQIGLAYRYLLQSAPDSPLVVLVHGRAGNFDVMWTFRRVIPASASILALQAPHSDKLGGYSWWDIDKQHRAAELAHIPGKLLLPALQRFCSLHRVRPRKIIGMGFSQGAGLLSLCAQCAESPFSAIALLAGFVIELPACELAHRVPVFMAHGSQDQAVPLEKAERGRDYIRSLGYPTEWHVDHVAHKVGAQGMRALKHWIETQCL